MSRTVIITGIPRSGLQIAAKFLSGQMGWMPEQERRFPRITMYAKKGQDPLSLTETDQMVFTQDPTYMYEWEVFNALYPDAYWFLVRRDPNSIIDSCKKTGWIDYCGESDKFWNTWHTVNMMILSRIRMSVKNSVEIWPHKLLNGDMSEIQTAISNFKLKEVV